MKLIKKLSSLFDGISHDIRLVNVKCSLITSVVAFSLGLLSWIIGGRADKVMLLYIFPRCSLPLGVMYFLWAISFIFIGFTIGGVGFGCEKFKKREAIKSVAFLILSFLCTLCVCPLFFKCLSPLFTFAIITVSAFFAFLAMISCLKIYSLWTICIILHFLC